MIQALYPFPCDDDDDGPILSYFFKVIRQSMCLFTSSKMKKVIEIWYSAGDPMTTTNVAASFRSMLICLSFLYQADSMYFITPYFPIEFGAHNR